MTGSASGSSIWGRSFLFSSAFNEGSSKGAGRVDALQVRKRDGVVGTFVRAAHAPTAVVAAECSQSAR